MQQAARPMKKGALHILIIHNFNFFHGLSLHAWADVVDAELLDCWLP
jgi:hypothetical protein